MEAICSTVGAQILHQQETLYPPLEAPRHLYPATPNHPKINVLPYFSDLLTLIDTSQLTDTSQLSLLDIG